MEDFEENIRRHNLAQQIRIASQFKEFDLNKGEAGQEGEIREWANGKKYQKKGGKWVLVSERRSKAQKQQAPKSKNKMPQMGGDQLPEETEPAQINRSEIAKLTTVKKIYKKDPVQAHELAESLSDEAKNIIPQDIWNKMSLAAADAQKKEAAQEKKDKSKDESIKKEAIQKVEVVDKKKTNKK